MVTNFDESVLVAPEASALAVERDGGAAGVDLVVESSLTVPGAAVVDAMLHSLETGSFMKHVTYTFPTAHASLTSETFRTILLQSDSLNSGPSHSGE